MSRAKPSLTSNMNEQYRANFLFGKDDEISELGYEFANAATEEYRQEKWNEIIAAAKLVGAEETYMAVVKAAAEDTQWGTDTHVLVDAARAAVTRIRGKDV
jgi:hypothetical protein